MEISPNVGYTNMSYAFTSNIISMIYNTGPDPAFLMGGGGRRVQDKKNTITL